MRDEFYAREVTPPSQSGYWSIPLNTVEDRQAIRTGRSLCSQICKQESRVNERRKESQKGEETSVKEKRGSLVEENCRVLVEDSY